MSEGESPALDDLESSLGGLMSGLLESLAFLDAGSSSVFCPENAEFLKHEYSNNAKNGKHNVMILARICITCTYFTIEVKQMSLVFRRGVFEHAAENIQRVAATVPFSRGLAGC